VSVPPRLPVTAALDTDVEGELATDEEEPPPQAARAPLRPTAAALAEATRMNSRRVVSGTSYLLCHRSSFPPGH
jgi:hypothetical protein